MRVCECGYDKPNQMARHLRTCKVRQVVQEREQLVQEREQLSQERELREQLVQEREQLVQEREQLVQERELREQLVQELREQLSQERELREQLVQERASLVQERASLVAERASLVQERDSRSESLRKEVREELREEQKPAPKRKRQTIAELQERVDTLEKEAEEDSEYFEQERKDFEQERKDFQVQMAEQLAKHQVEVAELKGCAWNLIAKFIKHVRALEQLCEEEDDQDEDLVRKQRRVEEYCKVRMTVNVVAVTNGDPPDMAALRLLANGNCALFMDRNIDRPGWLAAWDGWNDMHPEDTSPNGSEGS